MADLLCATTGVVDQLSQVPVQQETETKATSGWCRVLHPAQISHHALITQHRSAKTVEVDQAAEDGAKGGGAHRRPLPISHIRGAPVKQTGFHPPEHSQDAAQQTTRPPGERASVRRGRTSTLRGRGNSRRQAGNQVVGEQNFQPLQPSKHEAPAQAPPQIQFGQFAASSFNPN